MLGTLVRGRVTVGGSAAAAAQVALDIAVRYALQRRQFNAPGDEFEVVIMDYLAHQRRLLPLVARSYALAFAQNQLLATLHEVQSVDDPDPEEQRELESRAAGLKAANTWHATAAIQQAREACGGAGYLAENRLIELRADTDVFTTFEGDNTVLCQLVAKNLLTAYADDIKGMAVAGRKALERLNETSEHLRTLTKPGSPARRDLDQALADVSEAAQAIRSLADFLERNPETIIQGRSKSPAPAVESKEASPAK
jgi:hypothetical protein